MITRPNLGGLLPGPLPSQNAPVTPDRTVDPPSVDAPLPVLPLPVPPLPEFSLSAFEPSQLPHSEYSAPKAANPGQSGLAAVVAAQSTAFAAAGSAAIPARDHGLWPTNLANPTPSPQPALDHLTSFASGQTGGETAVGAAEGLAAADAPADAPPLPWWLSNAAGGTGLGPAWAMASGAGVRVGLLDDGIDAAHDLLVGATIRPAGGALLSAGADGAACHGTQVAALIVGQSNQVPGAASAATLVVGTLPFSTGPYVADIAARLAEQGAVADVSNNSWGMSRAFEDNFRLPTWAPVAAALADGVTEGRDGLGTVFVFAGGNGRMMIDGVNRGDDSNFHNLTNSRHTIAVAASDEDGRVAFFSSPGTNLLLAAPGIGMSSAGTAGGLVPVSGTSFAAPLVSGTVALMLQVNPALGYRDVQQILALTARADPASVGNANAGNGANGGGLIHDRDLGFGLLDATAAVRLAASWTAGQTAANEQTSSATHMPVILADPTQAVLQFDIAPGASALSVEWVSLSLTLTDQRLADLSIRLISPSGTIADLAPSLPAMTGRTWLDFSFSSAVTWGEDAAGTWTVLLSHPEPTARLSVWGARLDVFGALDGADDTFVFTTGFAALAGADPSRRIIMDEDGGHDRLNFAAGGPVDLRLDSGVGWIDGVAVTLEGEFEEVIGGVGADRVIGGGRDETLRGGAGSDTLAGGHGADLLAGEAGNDTLIGGAGNDVYIVTADDRVIERAGNGYDTVMSEEDIYLGRLGPNLDSAILTGTAGGIVVGNRLDNILTGNRADNLLSGGWGCDRLVGGEGNDTLIGGPGADTFVLSTTGGCDVLRDYQPGVDDILLAAGGSSGGAGVPEGGYQLWQAGAALWFDPDGAGGLAAVQVARLRPGTLIDLSDILVA